MTDLAANETVHIRSIVNRWISDNFPKRRRFLGHASPVQERNGWRVDLLARNGKESMTLGKLFVLPDTLTVVSSDTPETLAGRLDAHLGSRKQDIDGRERNPCRGRLYDFRFGDGIEGARRLKEGSVDLLLTDPPYGISNAYTCENQVPRRLRRNGKDFIMPRGHFGHWDNDFPSPSEWTAEVLPKIRGWAVIFCAQAQIGEYETILKNQRFVAVGAMVWQKTNPVPFNHAFKPINAWEAIVIGKRPGTRFNGKTVHNVFVCKSPSPQERIHPTQKPLKLISDFIEMFSDSGDTLFDPFAGSATSVIAARNKGRHILAYEKDEGTFDKAVARIESTEVLP